MNESIRRLSVIKCNVKKGITKCKALVLIVTISFTLAMHAIRVSAHESPKERASDVTVTRYATAQLLSLLPSLDEGALVETAGFHVPGDGAMRCTASGGSTTNCSPTGPISLP